jgi:hypothetical protein
MVDLHMPNYIPKALLKYQHPAPLKPLHAPYKAAPIQFGAQVQTVMTDTTAPLSKECIKRVQDIAGTLLYYGCAVGPTILQVISAITSHQAQGTEAMADACHQLLDYVATHPNAGIRYLASNMILTIHTNASYISQHNACSCASAHFYLTNNGNEKFINGIIVRLVLSHKKTVQFLGTILWWEVKLYLKNAYVTK